MGIKSFKPVTPSLRETRLITRDGLWKGKPMKILTTSLSEKAGRNNNGNITVRRRGCGHKKAYRIIDFKRNRFDIPAVVERIEYDPNRTSFIALIKYEDGIFAYILAPQKLNIGDKIISSKKAVDIKPGNAMPLSVMPIGSMIHNIEAKPGSRGTVARAAGNYAQLVGKDGGYALIKLQSGELKMFPLESMATVGVLSNPDKKNQNIGKAGRNRWLGKRPSVRGEVMNPVDHPLGGRTRGGRHPVSYSGVPAKGYKTRSKKKVNKFIIKDRRKK